MFLRENTRSAPHHPSTNCLAERFVQTLKAPAGQGTFHQRLQNFLLTYKNTPRSTTKSSPAAPLLKRALRTNLDQLKLPTERQIVESNQHKHTFHPVDHVLALSYLGEPKWVHAEVVAVTGLLSYQVRTGEDVVCERHTDQLIASKDPATKLTSHTRHSIQLQS